MAACERPVSLRVRIRSLSSRPKLALGVAISNWQAGRQAGRQADELATAYGIRRFFSILIRKAVFYKHVHTQTRN